MSQSEAYRLVQQLGDGLAGGVFLAETATGRVAIRQFYSRAEPDSAEWHSHRNHFLQGARQAASLVHPRIVSVIEVINEEVEAYLAMDYVPHETLAAVLGQNLFTPEKANYLLRSVAVAIDYAHQNGVTHGDLKPSNLFILPGGLGRISDFAISPRAWRERTGDFPEEWIHPYLAPEHIASPQTIGPGSDRYSLAAIAYCLYTGQALFSSTPFDVRAAIVQGAIPLPSSVRSQIPHATDRVLMKALSRDAQRRYGSCLGFIDALEVSLAPEPLLAPAGTSRSKLIYAGIGSLVAVAAITAAVWSSRSPTKVTPPRDPKPLVVERPAPPDPVAVPNSAPRVDKPVAAPGDSTSSTRNSNSKPASDSADAVRMVKNSGLVNQSNPQPLPHRIDAPATVDFERTPRRELLAALPVSADSRGPNLQVFSRTSVIEPGLSFSIKDSRLGELAVGDLKVAVSLNGTLPKGQLSVEWVLDGIRMDLKAVSANSIDGRGLSWVEYGNEPTPGTYKVVFRADRNVLKELTFRITP